MRSPTLRADARSDAGFSLVEMLIAMFVFAIIVPIAFGAMRNLTEQSVATNHLALSMEQDQTAGQSLVQFLHTATVVEPSSTASSLSAEVATGFEAATGTAGTALLTATCTPSGTADVGELVVTLDPTGGEPSSTRTFSVETPTATSSTECGLFRYGTGGSGSVVWSANASATSPVVAIDLSVTFLPGTTVPTEGAAARLSTLETEVYLQNVVTTTTVAP